MSSVVYQRRRSISTEATGSQTRRLLLLGSSSGLGVQGMGYFQGVSKLCLILEVLADYHPLLYALELHA